VPRSHFIVKVKVKAKFRKVERQLSIHEQVESPHLSTASMGNDFGAALIATRVIIIAVGGISVGRVSARSCILIEVDRLESVDPKC
jgi:hypothetical protein